MEKIKQAAKETDIKPIDLFESYDNDKSGKMEIEEFSEFLNHAAQETDKPTVDYLFKLVDKSNKNYISKEDMQRVLTNSDEVIQGKVIV